MSSSTGRLSDGLVGGIRHGLELGERALWLPPQGTSREEALGFDNGEPLARRPWGLTMAMGAIVMEVLGEGVEVDGGVGCPSGVESGSGCPSLGRGGVEALGRKGSSDGSGDRRHPPLRLW